ncbi:MULTISPECIES: hypothetical protein [Streptomyces]|nr:hypothetical protein [Streptomyces tirandamycinicus]
MSLDDVTWTRARGRAIAVGVSGISFYWRNFTAFAAECRVHLQAGGPR